MMVFIIALSAEKIVLTSNREKGIESLSNYDNLDIEIMMFTRQLVYAKIVWDTFFK